jgi:hypothetical protein
MVASLFAEETRIRWVQTHTRAEALYMRIREVVNEGVEAAEEKLGRVLEILSGGYDEAGEKVKEESKKGQEKAAQGGRKTQEEL